MAAWENNSDGAGGIWAIEGGAEHSARLARLGAWVSMGGLEGVLGSTECEVKPLDVPGTKVRIMPGAGGILNRALNHGHEMYLFDLVEEDDIDVPASGAGAARSHLVVARVENPYLDGEAWPIPPAEDRDKGPYGRGRLIPDVPSNTTSIQQVSPGTSAITLARIDVPASTGTIVQVMVHDLRTVVNPLTGGSQGPGGTTDPPPVVIPGEGTVLSTDSETQNWPDGHPWEIDIPAQATHADLSMNATGVRLSGGSFTAHMRMVIDSIGALPDKLIPFDHPGGAGVVQVPFALVYPDFPIPAALRGTKKNVIFTIDPVPGGTGSVSAGPGSQLICVAKFKQKPETTA